MEIMTNAAVIMAAVQLWRAPKSQY